MGSVLYLKDVHLHFDIHKWAKKYGPIFSGSIGTTPALFVTGADNVMAALRKEEFQGRPDQYSIRIRSFDKRLGMLIVLQHKIVNSKLIYQFISIIMKCVKLLH